MTVEPGLQFAIDLSVSDNCIQKTWSAEGTKEYRQFKSITQENRYLASFIKSRFRADPDDLVLDVGGRDGDIAFGVQDPRNVHIIDPDPFIGHGDEVGRFIRKRIQDVDLAPESYKLIICSHVLGYLSRDNVQRLVIHKLLNALQLNGTAFLFYNRNTDYLETLLRFSKSIIPHGHYDFFDESILAALDESQFEVERHDVDFKVEYESFDELGRCCWFLFGDLGNNISETARKFLPRLHSDLDLPSFSLEQRIVTIKRIAPNQEYRA